MNIIRQTGRRIADWWRGSAPQLRYFEDVLPIELDAINKRRGARPKVGPLPWESDQSGGPAKPPASSRPSSPDPESLFLDVDDVAAGKPIDRSEREKDVVDRKINRKRPQPVPCTATGLALSGGGVRSAAVCLGALQGLERHGRLKAVDYLSTVSGGGYIGASLSAAMSEEGSDAFPFGVDVFDSPAVSHLRNFSNYLLPRGRSALRNWGEAAAVIIRGLIANAVVLLAAVLFCVLITLVAFRNGESLSGSFLPSLLDGVLPSWIPIGRWIGNAPFGVTLLVLAALGLVLIVWAVARSFERWDRDTGDTQGRWLHLSRDLIVAAVALAFLDLQPIAIDWVHDVREYLYRPGARQWDLTELNGLLVSLTAFAGAVTAFASQLGKFLHRTRRATRWTTLLLRALTRLMVLAAAMIMPLLLWLTYLCLCAWAIHEWAPFPATPAWLTTLVGFLLPGWLTQIFGGIPFIYWITFGISAAIALLLNANGYSLHRFYRDRLSKAFLFDPTTVDGADLEPLDSLKLSGLRGGHGPYHIINAAMNVQGSFEANRRGRNADFFMFSPDFVGSDLTRYAATKPDSVHQKGMVAMEAVDGRLDLATAMAISGAAVSANMGSNTIRAMSPTLALLNVRLGYWLRNPHDLADESTTGSRIRGFFSNFTDKLYLPAEMLNLLDEKQRDVFLSDGGHIENLGLYELLKRGCALIVVVDAEADPTMSFESLLKVERYARIDFGVRIVLPWEEISRKAVEVNAMVADRTCPVNPGLHCAVGRIIYADGRLGTLVYVKSSISGDEKDYILDYKIRNPTFPHETTGDQFFSEEQFEMYRALGFHMMSGVFYGDELSVLEGKNGFRDQLHALEEIEKYLPKL